MSNDTPQEKATEQKLLRIQEGMVPPRILMSDVQKGMVPITFIPPALQQTGQIDTGQPSQQITGTPQPTTTQQPQLSVQPTVTLQPPSSVPSQSSEHK